MKQKYSKEFLEELVLESQTFSDLVRKITKKEKVHGNMVAFFRKKLTDLNINFEHFKGRSWSKNKKNPTFRALTKEDLFEFYLKKNPLKRTCSNNLKQYLFIHNVKENKCCECGLGNTWNGKPIKNQLDHIDGDSSNNEVENLRIVCPNCHSQTITFAGKNNLKR